MLVRTSSGDKVGDFESPSTPEGPGRPISAEGRRDGSVLVLAGGAG
jgi:hypothetical protein